MLLRILVLVKYQRPNLNTLPRLPLRRLGICKRGMRHPPRPPINLAIKTLDQHHLLGRLAIGVIPLVLLVRPDGQCLASAVWVDEGDGDEVGFRYRMRVRDGKGVFEDWLDGSPDIDNLVAGFEELVCFRGKVVWDTALGGRVGLVDVHAVHGPAEGGGGSGASVIGGTADGVVEDEDT